MKTGFDLIKKYRKVLLSLKLTEKTKINFSRALVLAPILNNVENFYDHGDISKACAQLLVKFKSCFYNFNHHNFELNDEEISMLRIVKQKKSTNTVTRTMS
eukprot:snap_masked-scaffold_27-processed-gene-2.43-mRNA-1 protein AED:1.00 eAED:1.00 QI:0/-1/0/0/-1/1/1/0/100